jgi:hypothetical protein
MMIRDALQDASKDEPPLRFSRPGRNIQQAQESVYNFLLGIVKKWPPEEVLLEFRRLFIYHVDSISSEALHAVYEIVFANNEVEFRNTLKRCCYILVNNWDATRNYKPIQELVQVFTDPCVTRYTTSPTLKRLRLWVNSFVDSKDYEELKLFVSRYEEGRGNWSTRYTSYLLVPQYVNLNNPIEQREAARALSRQLKDRFKFDLAMYIARSQNSQTVERKTEQRKLEQQASNPTALGDEVLRLIKILVAKRGRFSYVNLANIFLNQTQSLPYREFKQSLSKYLVFHCENREFVELVQTKLVAKLQSLYQNHDDDLVSPALMLRTCNRVIEYLTIEHSQEPSHLFVLLLSQGNPVTLVIVLLKIILICRHSRTHLETRIAELIQCYQRYPESECTWVVNFMEVFNVTFAIYAENVQYNLLKMEAGTVKPDQLFDPDSYRIFSQLRSDDFSPDLIAELLDSELPPSAS